MSPKHLAGMNLRQAVFHAAGWSEIDRADCPAGTRVHLYGVECSGVVDFYISRSDAKHPEIPIDNAVRVATFRFGDTEWQVFPLHSERDLWPAYPWRDADVAKENESNG